MPLILEGRSPAARITEDAARLVAAVTQRLGRAPALAAVAVDDGRPETLYFDVKQRAFEAAGAVFRPVVLPAGTDTRALSSAVRELNEDDTVDGIYVQYPLPEVIDAQMAYDEIDLLKDVDGASSLQSPEQPEYFPATAEAVIQLLAFHDVDVADSSVCIVRGDPLFAASLATLFREAGARPDIAALDDADAVSAQLATADIIVVATGIVHGVNAARFRDGAVVVDVGYYHGGGRGDIAATPSDIERMAAYAPPRGAIGPLTVALLIGHTAGAARRTLDRQAAH
ncbi:MAG TPA: bifunctional 5,10-methylenetetrahydrofolate dehydrogenase/5,10-methenyltetrahydrofolate cyclohydrolase [Longimicrobiales bacterium]